MITGQQRKPEFHKKCYFSLCDILESPLHVWPITLFYDERLEEKREEVNKKKASKVKKALMALFLLGLCLVVHSDSFGHGVFVQPHYRSYPQPLRYYNPIFFPSIYPETGVIGTSRPQSYWQEKKKRLEEREKAYLKKLKDQGEELDRLIKQSKDKK